MGSGKHEHEHQHEHGHHHHHDDDFDWEAMADHLELEATVLLPIVDEIVATRTPFVDWGSIRHVLDLGCGPGVVTCALARHAPAAQVAALDTSVPLLARARAHAAEADLARRVHTVEADMEAALPALRPMDLVWAGMVIHHVADPGAVLGNVFRLLQPGGTLVMIEFAGRPSALPDTDPLVASGAWSRMEEAVAAGISGRLGRDPHTLDWRALLSSAGFTDFEDRVMVALHPAPLSPDIRRWLTTHVRRSLEWQADLLDPADVAALTTIADDATRDDVFVRVERRVLTARRPMR